ncbi:hypothetical protein ABH931_005376 [Streptacidiphilus sp. MAP12-33]|uniref:hypothetical protein n=1 Tax=Streptacidiphilus sp. MAP12-33 TaxID=3156266 RepID=UPI003515679B
MRRDPRTGQILMQPPGASTPWGGDGNRAATQTARRFDLVHLDPFRYDTPEQINAWITHLTGIENSLRLFHAKPGMLTDGAMPEYLFRRTEGVVGLLERLIEDGCERAIDTGAECLTDGLLDGIDIDLGQAAGRDPNAGELPSVPPKPKARPARRPRNTVFDDHGPADETKAHTA